MSARASPSVIRARTSCPDLAAYRDRYAAEYARHGIFIPAERPQTRPLGTRVHLKIELADGGLGYSGAASVIEHVREGARVGYLLHLDEQRAGEGEPGGAIARGAPASDAPAARPPPPTAARTPPPAAPSARTPAPRATPAPAHVIGRVALTPAPRGADAPAAIRAPDLAAAAAAGETAASPDAAAKAPSTAPAPEGTSGAEAPPTPPAPAPSVLDTLFGAEGPAPAPTGAQPPRDPFGEEDAPPPDPFAPTPAPTPRLEPAVAPPSDLRVTPVPDAAPADTFVPVGARLSEADLFADAGAAVAPGASAEAAGADPTPTPTLSLERTDGASLSSPLRLPRPPLRVRLARHKVAVAATLVAVAGAVMVSAAAQRRSAAADAAFSAEIARVDDRVQAGRLAAPVGDAALDHLEAARRLLADDPRLTSRGKALADTFESLGRRALGRGDLQEAAAHFRSALRADPARASARAQLETISRTAPRHRGAAR